MANTTKKSAFLLTTAIVGLFATFPAAAWAQDSSSPLATQGDGDIVVTARKREENLQDVPLSITAISSETLQNQGVKNLRDIVNLTPGLTLSEFGAGTLNVPVVRGMTNLTAGAFAEGNVAVFYNGVYLQNNNLVDATFLDVERVEVIKGPVSALYGRNAYAGVINYVTKRPSSSFEGRARFVAGSLGRIGGEASVSGPISGDALKVRLAGKYDGYNGSWQDPDRGIRFGGYDRYAVQGSIELEPSESFNALATLFYAKDRFDQPARAQLGSGNCGAAAGAFQTSICGQIPDFTDATVIRSSNPRFELYGNRRSTLLGTLDMRVELGALEMKSITGFTDTSFRQSRDADGTGIGLTYNLTGTPAGTAQASLYNIGYSFDKSFSQELRATWEVSDSLILALGGFYNKFTADQSTSLVIDPVNVPAGRALVYAFPLGLLDSATGRPLVEQLTRLEDEESSVFGLVEFKLAPGFKVTGEARRSSQTKLQNQKSSILTIPFADPDGANGISANWKFWSFRVSANYEISPDTMVYASVAQGNKAGGFNSGVPDPLDLQYGPERNRTYEVGFKTRLFGVATFDVAAYYAKLDSLQINSVSADGLRSVVKNAGRATAYGFEAALSARVAEGVRFGLGLAYANPKFSDDSFLNSGLATSQCRNIPSCLSRVQVIPGTTITAVNLDGLSLPRQSDVQFSATVDVRRPLSGDWDWTLHGLFSSESKQFATTPPVNNGFIGDRNTLNARIGVANERFTIEAFVENALNDATPFNYGGGLNPINFQGPLAIVYGEKRRFGVEATMKF